MSEKVGAGKHVRAWAELRASAFGQGARLDFDFLLEVRAGAGGAEAGQTYRIWFGDQFQTKEGEKVRYKS